MISTTLGEKIMILAAAVTPIITVYLTQLIRMRWPTLEGKMVRAINNIFNFLLAIGSAILVNGEIFSFEMALTAALVWFFGYNGDQAFVNFHRMNLEKVIEDKSEVPKHELGRGGL